MFFIVFKNEKLIMFKKIKGIKLCSLFYIWFTTWFYFCCLLFFRAGKQRYLNFCVKKCNKNKSTVLELEKLSEKGDEQSMEKKYPLKFSKNHFHEGPYITDMELISITISMIPHTYIIPILTILILHYMFSIVHTISLMHAWNATSYGIS